MAVALPNGAILALATTYVALDTVSAITNANPAVVTTSASHGVATGGFIEMTSGWSRINNRIFRAASASGSSLALEGLNSTDTNLFPAGTGTGTFREISAWTQISQIMGLTTSGGDRKFVTYSFLEQDFESQLPDVSNAMSLQIDIADDPTLAGYIALKAANDSGALTGLRLTLKGGSIVLYNGYVSLNETPVLNKGAVNTVKATFSLQGLPVRYSS